MIALAGMQLSYVLLVCIDHKGMSKSRPVARIFGGVVLFQEKWTLFNGGCYEYGMQRGIWEHTPPSPSNF